MRNPSSLPAAIILIILFAGCASLQRPGQPPLPANSPLQTPNPSLPTVPLQESNSPSSSSQIAGNQAISVPFSPLSYTATYVVSEEGGDTQKTVWRMANSMKIRFGSQGAGVEIYLLGDKAYSCPSLPKVDSCFDITPQMAGAKLGELFPSPPKNYAGKIETVDIGGAAGNCYFLPYSGLGGRKTCFTDNGILAYDEYNVTKGSKHIEYLSELSYEVAPAEFLLPARAKIPPK